MYAKYINPFTDFGFKRIFGSEESKPLLISFLNDLLPIKHKIKTLTFNKNEYPGMLKEDRKAIFDIHCEDEKGNKFIVELQRAEQDFFQDRALYYTSFPIQEQATRGQWNFELTPIYFVGLLNFETFNDKNYLHYGQITDKYTNEVIYDKLTFIYIELPKFKKEKEKLSNHLEKWLWFFNKIETLEDIPEEFKSDENLEKAFHLAELAQMTPEERETYEQNLKYYRDYINTLDTALKKGYEKGIEKGVKEGIEKGIEKGKKETQIEIAKNLLDVLDSETISKRTGLSIEEIEKLKLHPID